MQQPELGKRLTALRKEKNLTQQELVEESHVSVRTIQRIEAGEVLPRLSTVKILLEALGESYESFSIKSTHPTETQTSPSPDSGQNTMLVATIAGAVYLVSEIILGGMNISRFTTESSWEFNVIVAYVFLNVVMLISFIVFGKGFIMLSNVFENKLLKVAIYLLIVATIFMSIFDVVSLSIDDMKRLWVPYASASLIFGALGILFGVSLVRLQDGMGILARIAGIMEIVMGCMLVTVVLFFVTYIILIPATVVEILILYRGYEYLSQSEAVPVS